MTLISVKLFYEIVNEIVDFFKFHLGVMLMEVEEPFLEFNQGSTNKTQD